MNIQLLFIVLFFSLAQITMSISAYDNRLRKDEDLIENSPFSISEPLFGADPAIAIPPRRIRYYRTGGTILLG
ncbi:unnamed protein product [Auanema sp. JU1783]|nr:unnamed protein product [Auanema sp. JU1783]